MTRVTMEHQGTFDARTLSDSVLFEERQRMRQPWVWILLAVVNIVVIGLFAHGLYQQLYQGRPWGNNPTSDTVLLVIAVCVIGFTLGLSLLLWFMELYVRVDREHLTVRFRPLIHKRIPIGDITAWEACTYQPIWEFGGWGIRYSLSRNGWAYTVAGNQGVRIRRANAKERLIGSRRAAELAAALAKAKAMRHA